jgi:hypothetical protein
MSQSTKMKMIVVALYHTRELHLSSGKRLRPKPTFPKTISCRQLDNSELLPRNIRAK